MSVTYSGDAATTRTSLGLGDVATKTVGTAAGNIPVLDGSGKMPAVDGSALTGIEALPAGGTVGQVVTNTASGVGGWADASGKVVGMGTYLWGVRFLPSHSAGWSDWYGNTYNKQSATSTLIFHISISSHGEYGGTGQHYWRLGNTNSAVVAAQYGNTSYGNQVSHTFVITGNTQTGPQSWMFLGDFKGYPTVNPNGADSGDYEQNHTYMTIMEVEV